MDYDSIILYTNDLKHFCIVCEVIWIASCTRYVSACISVSVTQSKMQTMGCFFMIKQQKQRFSYSISDYQYLNLKYTNIYQFKWGEKCEI